MIVGFWVKIVQIQTPIEIHFISLAHAALPRGDKTRRIDGFYQKEKKKKKSRANCVIFVTGGGGVFLNRQGSF